MSQIYYHPLDAYHTLSSTGAKPIELDENEYVTMTDTPTKPLYLNENIYITEDSG